MGTKTPRGWLLTQDSQVLTVRHSPGLAKEAKE